VGSEKGRGGEGNDEEKGREEELEREGEEEEGRRESLKFPGATVPTVIIGTVINLFFFWLYTPKV
jgi:hypothetical protein